MRVEDRFCMKSICIDGFNLALSKGSGIATYGRNLLTNVQAIGLGTQVLYGPSAPYRKSPVLNEIALIDAAKAKKPAWLTRHARIYASRFGRAARPVRPTGEVIWPRASGGMPQADFFWTSRDLFRDANAAFARHRTVTPLSFAGQGAGGADERRPDVMHWTAPLPLEAQGMPNIYTIHDLIPLRLPHTTLDNKAAFLAQCRRIARRADHIAVVSEKTREDVIRLLGVSEDRVTNTYQAVSVPAALADRSQDEVARELEGTFNLGWKDYFLYFGAIEPKKNLGRIVEAYLASGVDSPLVVIGGRAWLEQGETALMTQIKASASIVASKLLPYEYMPFAMLVSLIRGAKATLFPSLYEGFGLPVLESMALDTAVLTSTGGSLPEVAGDAALIVDPYDVPAITRGIRALDADAGLRDDLVARGRVQAAKFAPEIYQARLRELYATVGA